MELQTWRFGSDDVPFSKQGDFQVPAVIFPGCMVFAFDGLPSRSSCKAGPGKSPQEFGQTLEELVGG